MENPLFRKKSLERISSPEQLSDYMRVTSPGIWMVLAAVIALLIGLIAVAATGTLETTLDVTAHVRGGAVSMQLPPDKKDAVSAGMPVRIAGRQTEVALVYQDGGELTLTANVEGLPDGAYDAQIVTDSVSPIEFLLN